MKKWLNSELAILAHFKVSDDTCAGMGRGCEPPVHHATARELARIVYSIVQVRSAVCRRRRGVPGESVSSTTPPPGQMPGSTAGLRPVPTMVTAMPGLPWRDSPGLSGVEHEYLSNSRKSLAPRVVRDLGQRRQRWLTVGTDVGLRQSRGGHREQTSQPSPRGHIMNTIHKA